MRFGRVQFRLSVQSAVDRIQVFAEIATYVEPPVADEERLTELRAVGAEEGRLSAVDVAVVPRLASGVHVGEESRVWLFVAVEVRVRYYRENWIVCSGSTCNIQCTGFINDI